MQIQGQIVDPIARRIFPGTIRVEDGKIHSITEEPIDSQQYILPGFVDAHIHIESSMLVPSEFARLAVLHGTVATVSDPHEIANVLGTSGVYYMIENGAQTPFKFSFGAPSCVPATQFETAGATIDAQEIAELLAHPEIRYLAEMMNYPGVLMGDPEVLKKIQHAKSAGKPIDGHAPGLRGEDAQHYINAGISTDHECFSYEEGLEKLQLGMKVIIREGSAAKNFDTLLPLLDTYYEQMMFCSDDKHPDDLLLGHINQLVARAIAVGNDLFKVLQVACVNPVKHYKLPVGLLQVGDPADFIVVDNLQDFTVCATYIDGQAVAKDGTSFIQPVAFDKPNQFKCDYLKDEQFQVAASGEKIRVIEALDGELITNELLLKARIENGLYQPDIERDLLKIAVINRYQASAPSVGFIKNFGLKTGAIASTVGHDSHNLLVVGTSDEAMCQVAQFIDSRKRRDCRSWKWERESASFTDCRNNECARRMGSRSGLQRVRSTSQGIGKQPSGSIHDTFFYGIISYSGLKDERFRFI